MRIGKPEAERQYAEVSVSTIRNDEKVRMARALLDTEFVKSLIFEALHGGETANGTTITQTNHLSHLWRRNSNSFGG